MVFKLIFRTVLFISSGKTSSSTIPKADPLDPLLRKLIILGQKKSQLFSAAEAFESLLNDRDIANPAEVKHLVSIFKSSIQKMPIETSERNVFRCERFKQDFYNDSEMFSDNQLKHKLDWIKQDCQSMPNFIDFVLDASMDLAYRTTRRAIHHHVDLLLQDFEKKKWTNFLNQKEVWDLMQQIKKIRNQALSIPRRQSLTQALDRRLLLLSKMGENHRVSGNSIKAIKKLLEDRDITVSAKIKDALSVIESKIILLSESKSNSLIMKLGNALRVKLCNHFKNAYYENREKFSDSERGKNLLWVEKNCLDIPNVLEFLRDEVIERETKKYQNQIYFWVDLLIEEIPKLSEDNDQYILDLLEEVKELRSSQVKH